MKIYYDKDADIQQHSRMAHRVTPKGRGWGRALCVHPHSSNLHARQMLGANTTGNSKGVRRLLVRMRATV